MRVFRIDDPRPRRHVRAARSLSSRFRKGQVASSAPRSLKRAQAVVAAPQARSLTRGSRTPVSPIAGIPYPDVWNTATPINGAGRRAASRSSRERPRTACRPGSASALCTPRPQQPPCARRLCARPARRPLRSRRRAPACLRKDRKARGNGARCRPARVLRPASLRHKRP